MALSINQRGTIPLTAVGSSTLSFTAKLQTAAYVFGALFDGGPNYPFIYASNSGQGMVKTCAPYVV